MATLTTNYQKIAEKKLGNTGYGDVYIRLYAKYNSQSIANNTTNVSLQARLYNGGTWYASSGTYYRITGSGSIDSGNVSKLTSASNMWAKGEVTLGTQTKDISHNTDGTRSIHAEAKFVSDPWGWNATASATDVVLPSIPRYATSNQSLKSKTETTITMNWSSDSTIDYVWYSTDWGTTWKDVGSVNATSGSYTISKPSNSTNNLSAYTTYNVMTKVRRKDSQLTTISSKLSVTTEDYPYCTSTPNFTIGNALTIGLHNPLGRNCTVTMLGADGSVIYSGDGWTGTTVQDFKPDYIVNNLYASIPNAKSGTYTIKVTYGSSTKTKTGGTYSIVGNETPTVGSISYADTNEAVTKITGNNQHIVQNQSNLKVTYGVATAKKSASISKYKFTLNGVTRESTSAGGTIDFGKVNSANNLTLTMTVTDSRGLTASATKNITMLEHSSPNAIVTLERLNNYEDESYLTVDASISSVNNKNTMSIKYRYKVSGGSYGEDYTTINDNEKQTLTLDKNNAYIFNVVITDAFGSTYNKEHALGKGVFPLFIDTEKNSVGINCFPTREKSLEVNGKIVKGSTVVSSTTPTEGEEVWIQKGKNYFNKNDIKPHLGTYTSCSILETGIRATVTGGNWYQFCSFKLDKYLMGKKITITADMVPYGNSVPQVAIFYGTDDNTTKQTADIYFKQSGSVTGTLLNEFPSGCNELYLVFNSNLDGTVEAGAYVDYTNVQLEIGEKSTPYEPYIEKKIYTKNNNGDYEELINASEVNILIPQRIYPSFNWDYVYSTDLQYTCFKVGRMAFLNIHTLGFKSSAPNGTTIISGLPKSANNQFICMYLDGGNGDGLYSCRCLVTPGGTLNIHWGSPTQVGDSANKQYRGFLMYETND